MNGDLKGDWRRFPHRGHEIIDGKWDGDWLMIIAFAGAGDSPTLGMTLVQDEDDEEFERNANVYFDLEGAHKMLNALTECVVVLEKIQAQKEEEQRENR